MVWAKAKHISLERRNKVIIIVSRWWQCKANFKTDFHNKNQTNESHNNKGDILIVISIKITVFWFLFLMLSVVGLCLPSSSASGIISESIKINSSPEFLPSFKLPVCTLHNPIPPVDRLRFSFCFFLKFRFKVWATIISYCSEWHRHRQRLTILRVICSINQTKSSIRSAYRIELIKMTAQKCVVHRFGTLESDAICEGVAFEISIPFYFLWTIPFWASNYLF